MHHARTPKKDFDIKRTFMGLAIGAVAVFTLACGGGGDDEPDPTATSAGASGAPAATSQGGTTPAAGATSNVGGSGKTASIANLNSYKYTIKMSGSGGPLDGLDESLEGLGANTSNPTFEIAGSYIKPDKAQTTMKIAGLETSVTIIGNQQWTSFMGQTIGPSPATATDITDANFLADFWTDDDLGDAIKDFKCGNKENVNGVSATKCSLDKAGFEKLAKEDPDFMSGIDVSSLTRATIDVWVADANFPVRMRMDVAGKETSGAAFDFKVEMEVTDVNANFQISAPRT